MQTICWITHNRPQENSPASFTTAIPEHAREHTYTHEYIYTFVWQSAEIYENVYEVVARQKKTGRDIHGDNATPRSNPPEWRKTRGARLCTPIHAALFCAVIVSSAIRSANFSIAIYTICIFLFFLLKIKIVTNKQYVNTNKYTNL